MDMDGSLSALDDVDQSEMSCSSGGAAWCALRCSDSLLHQAEEVLREQQDHEQRRELSRNMDRQGLVSPLRKIIAGNVRPRLLEYQRELDSDAYEVQQKCTNIKNQLNYMASSRRELALLRRAVEGTKDAGVVRYDLRPEERASASTRTVQLGKGLEAVQPHAAADLYRDDCHRASKLRRAQSKEKWDVARRNSSAALAFSQAVEAAKSRRSAEPVAEAGLQGTLPAWQRTVSVDPELPATDYTAEVGMPVLVKMSTLAGVAGPRSPGQHWRSPRHGAHRRVP
jgi:hypothetical protein